MPMSVLEAMAAGLPVVASDVGDVARLVDDGATGHLVSPHSPDELASALRKLILEPERAAEMGASGRERVERHFSAEVNARAVCAVYAEASGERA
jgi:glycosyltransferase involved in cell wall biosynthesis